MFSISFKISWYLMNLMSILSLAETPLWSAINYPMAFMRTRLLTDSSLHGLIRLFVKGCSGLVRLAGNQALFYLLPELGPHWEQLWGFISVQTHTSLTGVPRQVQTQNHSQHADVNETNSHNFVSKHDFFVQFWHTNTFTKLFIENYFFCRP